MTSNARVWPKATSCSPCTCGCACCISFWPALTKTPDSHSPYHLAAPHPQQSSWTPYKLLWWLWSRWLLNCSLFLALLESNGFDGGSFGGGSLRGGGSWSGNLKRKKTNEKLYTVAEEAVWDWGGWRICTLPKVAHSAQSWAPQCNFWGGYSPPSPPCSAALGYIVSIPSPL